MAVLLLGGTIISTAFAGQQNIPMHIIDKDGVGNGHTYAPPRPWYIIQDDYTLTLPLFEDDYILELRDEAGHIHTADWERGVYIIRADQGKEVISKKIVIK